MTLDFPRFQSNTLKIFKFVFFLAFCMSFGNTAIAQKFTKVKGKAFGMKEITLKTYYKDGKKIKEKSVKSNMTKIEIYGFENISQLKAVLAHEIGHLVGIPHINAKKALMNPILQKNQINELFLTNDDIDNFNTNF